jgi:hypothetical protein
MLKKWLIWTPLLEWGLHQRMAGCPLKWETNPNGQWHILIV